MQIVDSSDSELAVAQTVLAFTPSTMTGCTYVGSNDTTGVNSSRTVSFTPSVEAIAGATLDITLPIWFDSTGSALDSLACTGVQVNMYLSRILIVLLRLASVQCILTQELVPSIKSSL